MYSIHISLLVVLALQWAPTEVFGKTLPETELNPVAVASQLSLENEQKGIPAELEFEGGASGDNQLVETTREKRTIGMIGRMTTCLFTFLINPNCLNQMNQMNQQSSYQRSYQSQPTNNYYQQQMQYLQQQLAWQRAQNLIMSRYNGSDSNSSTNYPYPILSTYPPEQQPTESPTEAPPTNPILDIINAKINFVPNMLRMFFPGLFGNQNRYAQNRPSYNTYNSNPYSYNQAYTRSNNNNNLFG